MMFNFILSFLPTNPIWSALIILLCVFMFKEYQRIRYLPPGPYGLPLLGYMFSIDTTNLSQQAWRLRKKYKSDIVSFSVFRSPFVIISSLDLLKEVFQKRTTAVDRPDICVFAGMDDDFTGILATSGRKWKEVRRFCISALRDFGMGRVGAEERIQTEVKYLCDVFKKQGNAPINPRESINMAVSNIICGMVFGKRFEYDDDDFLRSLHGMHSFMTGQTSIFLFILMRFDFCRKYVVKDRYQKILGDYETMCGFVRKQIKEHKDTYTGEKTDVIYSFLKEMEENRDPDIFDDKMLECLIIDFFFAGSETTYTTLLWGLLAMAAHPDIQKKVQEELDTVIGDRPVCMIDKKQTVYTEAVMSEIQRHYTTVPFGPGHVNNEEEIEIAGYRLPKKSLLQGSLYAIHHDERNWPNPEEFDPGNFFQDGKVVNLDKLVPFGVGRRSCAGEALARMELYIFFATLMKNFDVKPETDDTEVKLTGKEYAAFTPDPFKIRLIARN